MPDGDPPPPGRTVRLFLSHRSHDERTRKRLGDIANLLAGHGIEVLYDAEQIENGRHWREAINAMLVACDAAAVLLTPEALDSPWVLKEATILRWRLDRDEMFPLLPVVLDDLDLDTLKGHRLWDPIDLPALQTIADGDAKSVAEAVRDAILPVAEKLMPTPLDLLAADIAKVLTEYAHRLGPVVGTLDESVPARVADEQTRSAHAIARSMLRHPPPALKRVTDALVKLGPSLTPAHAKAVIKLVAPLWIELDAVALFRRCGWERPQCRDVAMECAKPPVTITQYVERAYFPDRAPKQLRVTGISAGHDVEDVRRELAEQFAETLEEIYSEPPDGDEFDRWLRALVTRVFVVMPMPADPATVQELQRSFPRLTFVFHSTPSAEEPAAVPAGVARVEPRLDPRIEDLVSTDFGNALARF